MIPLLMLKINNKETIPWLTHDNKVIIYALDASTLKTGLQKTQILISQAATCLS